MNKIFAAALLLLPAVAAAEIRAGEAWARFTVAGQQAGGVFMQLHNDGAADALIGAETPLAEKVEIHTHVMHEGRMRMEELAGGLPLPQGGRAVLRPGAEHVMLIGLKQPLAGGTEFPLTLHFRHAPPLTVKVAVRTPAQEAAAGGRDHGHRH